MTKTNDEVQNSIQKNILSGGWTFKKNPELKIVNEIPHNLIILKVGEVFVISVTKNILSYVKRYNKTITRFNGYGKVFFPDDNPPKAKVFKSQLFKSKKEAESYRTEFIEKFEKFKKQYNESMKYKREYFFDFNSYQSQSDVNDYFNKLNNESILKVG